jgi:26S proteasome non-ATPase regulatory subunit 5
VVKLFSVSTSAASAIHSLNLLKLLEEEIRRADDTLVTLSVFELLYEVAILSLYFSVELKLQTLLTLS